MADLAQLELLELQDGETIRMHIARWEEGIAVIHPAYGPAEKRVQTLRVWPLDAEKTTGAPYWDITSQRLIARLRVHLSRDDWRQKGFTITKQGVAPRATFTLEVT